MQGKVGTRKYDRQFSLEGQGRAEERKKGKKKILNGINMIRDVSTHRGIQVCASGSDIFAEA